VLVLHSFDVRLVQVSHPLLFKVTFAYFVKFSGLRVEFKSVLVFQVFLDSHPENVLVDGQLHLGVDRVHLLLLLLENRAQVVDSHLVILLHAFAGAYLLDELGLVLGALVLDN